MSSNNYNTKEKQRPFSKTMSLVMVLVFLVVLPMLATDIYLPALPTIEVEFRATHASALLTLTAYMIGYSSSLIFSGVLSDRYGRRPIILIGALIFTTASIASIFVNSIADLIALRFFQAFGGGCGTLLARVVVRDAFDQQNQVRILSYLSAGLALSPTLGPILGGFLVAEIGWRAPFVFISGFAGVTFFLSLFFLKETRPPRVAHAQQPSTLSQFLSLLCHREFMAYTLIISFAWAVYFSFIASSSFLLQQKFGLGPIAYGFSFALVISGYIAGTVFTRKQIKTKPLDNLIHKASALMLGGTLAAFLITLFDDPNPFLLLAMVAVSLSGVGVIFPTTQAGVMRPFSGNYGLVASLFYATEMLFGAITGGILGYFKSENPIVMTSIMASAATLMYLTVRFLLYSKKSQPISHDLEDKNKSTVKSA